MHIPPSERRSFTESVLVFGVLGECSGMEVFFVLFFLFVAGLYEEACFVRFKGYNGQFDLAWLA